MIWLAGDRAKVVASWVAAGIPGCERGWDECVVLSVWDGPDSLIAGVVYHDFVPEYGVISMTTFARDPKWLTRKVLWEMFDYPFNRAGCQMVYLQVSERNRRMLRIARRFGFDLTRIPRGRGRDEAEMLCTLTDDQWRASKFYRCPDGETETSCAA